MEDGLWTDGDYNSYIVHVTVVVHRIWKIWNGGIVGELGYVYPTGENNYEVG